MVYYCLIDAYRYVYVLLFIHYIFFAQLTVVSMSIVTFDRKLLFHFFSTQEALTGHELLRMRYEVVRL